MNALYKNDEMQFRMSEISAISLSVGKHQSIDQGMCVMEAVSYVAGEPWSDTPQCACPVLTTFLRSWNDGLSSNAKRDKLLKPLIIPLIGTRSTDEVATHRSFLVMDWLIRVCTPKWLDLVPKFVSHAKALRELNEIVDIVSAKAAIPFVTAACDAVLETTFDPAREVAREAVRNSAGYAAWRTAPYAWYAAWKTTRDAWCAAVYGARCAAVVNVGVTDRNALIPTTEWLQASSLELIDRMIEAKV